MRKATRMIATILEIVIGAVLLGCNIADVVDEFWGGMGTALLVMGVIFLLRQIRYRRNEAYREAVDVEVNDERNKYISMKAWSWTGYLFVLIAAVGAIVLKLLGREDYMFFASGSVCLMVLLYWVTYMVLKKKY